MLVILCFSDLKSLLNQLQLSLAGSFNIEICRSHVLCDALKEAKKKKIDPMKNLRVCAFKCMNIQGCSTYVNWKKFP